jgi:hypothetical protein
LTARHRTNVACELDNGRDSTAQNVDCELASERTSTATANFEGRKGGRNRRAKHICRPRRIWIRECHSLSSCHNRRIGKLSLASYLSLCFVPFVLHFLLLASSRTLFFEANLPNPFLIWERKRYSWK